MIDPLTANVVELTRPCFVALNRLRALADAPSADPSIQEVYRRTVDEARESMSAARLERRDADDIAYAIVALIDELASSGSGPLRDEWIGRPLQVHYFDENTAGDGFFRRLAEAQGRPERRHVLAIYHLCLLFGFRGRYAIRGESSLREIAGEIGDELFPEGEEAPALAPDGPPSRAGAAAGRRFSLIFVGVGLFLASLAVFVGLRLHLDALADGVVRESAAATAEIRARGGAR